MAAPDALPLIVWQPAPRPSSACPAPFPSGRPAAGRSRRPSSACPAPFPSGRPAAGRSWSALTGTLRPPPPLQRLVVQPCPCRLQSAVGRRAPPASGRPAVPVSAAVGRRSRGRQPAEAGRLGQPAGQGPEAASGRSVAASRGRAGRASPRLSLQV